MAIIRFVVGVWLLAAPWARAQRVVAPVEGRGRTMTAASAPMLPASASVLLAPPMPALTAILAPALSVAAPPLPQAPVLQAPTPIQLAAVHAAVAQFSAIDLQSAPAAEVREGADALMARALGAEVSEVAAPVLGSLSAAEIRLAPPSAADQVRESAPVSRVHLLSKPLHETVELGLRARVLHYALGTAIQFVLAGITWQATGSPTAGLSVLAFNLITMPPSITVHSIMNLGLRYWWRKLATLRRLADTPGVTRIRVLTTGETKFSGILAQRRENTGLVFMDASGTLPGTIPGLGAPIAVPDVAERRMRLVLVRDGVSDLIPWVPTLAQVLSRTPISADVAAAWRARLNADKKAKELRVEAHLSDGAGGETALGTIVFGRSVKRLVGLGFPDRVGALFGRAPVARAIPLSDTTVERGGTKTPGAVVLRAWRRLTGALIVRP